MSPMPIYATNQQPNLSNTALDPDMVIGTRHLTQRCALTA